MKRILFAVLALIFIYELWGIVDHFDTCSKVYQIYKVSCYNSFFSDLLTWNINIIANVTKLFEETFNAIRYIIFIKLK